MRVLVIGLLSKQEHKRKAPIVGLSENRNIMKTIGPSKNGMYPCEGARFGNIFTGEKK